MLNREYIEINYNDQESKFHPTATCIQMRILWLYFKETCSFGITLQRKTWCGTMIGNLLEMPAVVDDVTLSKNSGLYFIFFSILC